MRRAAVLAVAALALVACGGDGDGDATESSGTSGATAPDAVLPPECTRPPFQAVVERDGNAPLGSDTFQVVSTAGLPVPLVPNADKAIPDTEVMGRGGETDLLGYVVFFGDEEFGTADVSLFGGYEPAVEGKVRGAVSVFPDSATPLAAGQTLLPGPATVPNLFTTLLQITLDVKGAPGEFTSYVGDMRGQVTILALGESAICLDVDLAWDYSTGGATADGTLTVKGIFTADLAPRSLPFT